jgi:hypothetical protein
VCGAYQNQNIGTPIVPEELVARTLSDNPINYSFDLKSGEYFRLSIKKRGTGVGHYRSFGLTAAFFDLLLALRTDLSRSPS